MCSFLSKILLILSASLPVWASNQWVAPVPINLSYKASSLPASELLTQEGSQEIFMLSNFLEAQKLAGINSQFGSGAAVFDVDQVFTDVNAKRAVFMKLDLEPTNQKYLNQIFVDRDSYLFHGKTSHGVAYALFFTHFTSKQVHDLVGGIQNAVNQPIQHHSFWQLIRVHLSSQFEARAEDNYTSSSTKEPSRLVRGTEQKRTHGTREQTRNFEACMKGIASGVYDATIGSVIDIYHGLIKVVKSAFFAITHPMEAWHRSEKRFNDVVSLFKHKNFKKELAQGQKEYNKMTREQKTHFTCWLSALVGTDLAVAFINPASSAGVALQVYQALDAAEAARSIVIEGDTSEYGGLTTGSHPTPTGTFDQSKREGSK
jgi:hypothetical protein